MISVLLVDDHPVVVEGLRKLLAAAGDITVVGEARDAAGAIEQARTLRPDVILLDLRMPGVSGIDVQAELARRRLGWPVVMLTAHGDIATTRAALKGGAYDFIEKPFDDEVLLQTIRAATQQSAERRTQAERETRFARDLERLTAREREVLGHVLAGHIQRFR